MLQNEIKQFVGIAIVLFLVILGGFLLFSHAAAPEAPRADNSALVAPPAAPQGQVAEPSAPLLAGGDMGATAPTAATSTATHVLSPLATDRKAEVQAAFAAKSILDIVKDKALLQDSLQVMGISAVMSKLVAESNGGSTFDCHQEAHYIGRNAYDLFKEKAFAECDASCHSGCYHGAMETMLQEKGTGNLAATIDSVCQTFSTSFGIFECLHGVGHGILAYMNYDLPATLKECGKLSSNFETTSCYGGAFMENVLTGEGLGASSIHTTTWVSKNPQFPCSGIDQDFNVQYQCYQMQTSWMLWLNGYNFDGVKDECLKAPGNMIPVCFKSYGRDAAGNSLRDAQKIVPLCEKVPAGDNRNQCAIGAVNVIVDFWGGKLDNQATVLCSLFKNDEQKACYETLAWRLGDVFGGNIAKKTAVCNGFDEKYRYLCNT